MVGVIGGVGLMVGVLYWASHPVMPSATAQVLLPTPSATATAAGSSSPSADAQKLVAKTSPVLTPAAAFATHPISESLLSKRVKVTAVGSSNLLSITVKSPRPADAVNLANGVAKAYIAVSPQYFSQGLQSQLATDSKQEVADIQQIQTLSNDVKQNGATSAAGVLDQAEIQNLETVVSADEANDATLKSQIAANTPQLVAPATVNPVSRLAGPEDAAGGLLVGLVVGSAAALWKGRRDRRLRRRDDLARAMGLPVLASLDAEGCERAEDWNLLLDSYQPETVDAWSLRRLLHQLDPGDSDSPVALEIVSYAEDEAALSVGVQMASFATSMGISTTLLAGDHYAIETLRAACAISAQSPPPEALLSFVKEDPTDTSIPQSELTITVVAMDRKRPHFEMSGGVLTLVALSAGLATSDDLARLALAATDAGTTLDGIIVVNPDDHDYTSGDLPSRALRVPPVPRLPEKPLADPITEDQDEQ
jgi:capsular polysaccharide biosynthesis protein